MTTPSEPDNNQEFETLLNYLKRARAFDFSGYKPASLTRRILRRMQSVNVETFSEYMDYLEVHPDEFTQLFDTVLINVTSFFRDPQSWEYIGGHVVPSILASKKPDEPIRVWSAGCASGEEAYTAAIILAEALGEEMFRERVKIYASDADEDALNHARLGSYTTREVAPIPPTLLSKYFERTDHRYAFRKDLRRTIIFGRHNLTQDAPISKIDLLICRNVLMYFNAEAQARILTRFHFALNENGFLFLGKAEMLFTHANLFTPSDLKRRVFTKVPHISLRDRLLLMGQNDSEEIAEQLARHVRFRESAFDTSPVAQIVVDFNNFIGLINERARKLFGLTAQDLNRPLSELELSYRVADLRARTEEVFKEHRPITLKETPWTLPTGEVRYLQIELAPLFEVGSNGIFLGVSINFTDVSHYQRLQLELEHANQELETAYEELQSTNEELETTNEELQSTVEELETTNEELQSTNEELETINEELQSTNEEMQTLNEELRRRSDELNQVNSFMESILTSLRGGVVVVNSELQVQVWNHKSEDLWGLRPNEVQGKHFLNLDIGLPVDQLRPMIRACLANESEFEEMTLDAINRRGKSIRCRVSCTPLHDDNSEVRGVILMMEDISGARPQSADGNSRDIRQDTADGHT